MNSNCKAKVCAYTLGCKVNQYDTAAMLEILEKEGFEIVRWGQFADIFLINTCTVTDTADKKSRNAISHARRINENAKIIVCGCMAQSSARELLKTENVKAVIGTDNRLKIAHAAKACLEEKDINEAAENSFEFEPLTVTHSGERTRAYIKVQEGCSNFCSYCIIPFVRGLPRSRPLNDAVDEAEILASNGVKELVITGVNLTSYRDSDNRGFADLICQIATRVPDTRIRLGSLDVYNLDDEDLIRLSKIENLCPHFHISLQSGSDGVLKRMRRKYTASEFLDYIEKIRKYWSDPAITTDIIAGFPQESDTEFAETENFIKKAEFARLHVFPYSEREGTAAAKMEGAIPKKVRKARTKRLIEIGALYEQKYIDSMIGKSATILFENQNENGCTGYTERYIETACPNGTPGDMAEVRLSGRKGSIAYAELLNNN